MRFLVLRAAILASSLAVAASEAGCIPAQSPWTVGAVRERQPGEVPFEDATGYLFRSPDPNVVPGPDSLVALAPSDSDHRRLDLEDRRSGTISTLLEARVSLPQWSPDGKYISCVVWKSPAEYHELQVIEVASGRVIIDPSLGASGSWSKWSPDGRTLAASGGIYGKPKQMLYAVKVPSGQVTALDTLNIVADYGFSWSPDGRWLAFTKPIALDSMGEDPVAADLWIAEPATGGVWPLLETQEWIEENPLWITNQTILIDRIPWKGSESRVQQTVVVELKRSERPGTE